MLADISYFNLLIYYSFNQNYSHDLENLNIEGNFKSDFWTWKSLETDDQRSHAYLLAIKSVNPENIQLLKHLEFNYRDISMLIIEFAIEWDNFNKL